MYFGLVLGPAARHAQRGQAIIETVIFMPLFLLTLFGMLWAVKAAVQFERVQSALRYSWSVSQRANPYGDFSFYSMYSQLGVTTMPAVTCSTPLVDPLSDAAPTYTSTQTTTASPSFFSPLVTPTPICLATGNLYYFSNNGSGQDVILSFQEQTISSSVAVPTSLTGVLGSTSAAASTAFGYQQIGVNVILACFPAMNTLVNASLNYTSDVSSPTMPTPINYNASCCPYIKNGAGTSVDHTTDYFAINTQCGYRYQ